MKFKHLLLALTLALVALPGLATAHEFEADVPTFAVADTLAAPALEAAPSYLANTAYVIAATAPAEVGTGLCTVGPAGEAYAVLLTVHDAYRSEVTADATSAWRR